MTYNGTLIAIGGGMDLNGPILPEFYKLSGGTSARIVILPTASQVADCGDDLAGSLNKLGLRQPARILPVYTQENANCPEYCAMMRDATGLFITGGDQTRLMRILRGTAFYAAMRAMFHDGGTIAGTSAGTAALSALMISSGESGMIPQKGIANFSTGLGLIDNCVFDQHFRQRNRVGRLLYAVACHPSLLGIGVDEDTAVIIEKNVLRVIGSGTVTLVDGKTAPPYNPKTEISRLVPVSGVQLHVMTPGGRYDLMQRNTNPFRK